jgi:hypothetical protein
MRWLVFAECMGAVINANRILVIKPKGRRQFGILSIFGRIISKWILKELGCEMWVVSIWLGIGSRGGLLYLW